MNIIDDNAKVGYNNREYNAADLRYIWNELDKLALRFFRKDCRVLLIDDNSLVGCLLYSVLFFNNYKVLAISSSILDKNHKQIYDDYQYGVLINCIDSLLLDMDKYHIHSISQICVLGVHLTIAKSYDYFIKPEDLGGVYFFSSGSSGRPKLIVHSHESTLEYILDSIKIMDINNATRHIVCSSISWDVWLTEVFSIMLAGGFILLCDRSQTSNPYFLGRIIDSYSINSLQLTQSQFNSFIIIGSNFKKIKKIIFTGESCFSFDYSEYLSPEVIIFNIYGSTEMHNVLYSKHDLSSFSKKGMLLDCLYPDVSIHLKGDDRKKLYVVSKYNCQNSSNSRGEIDSGDYMIETNDGYYYCEREDDTYSLSQLQIINNIRSRIFSFMREKNVYFRSDLIIKNGMIYIFIEEDANGIIDFELSDITNYSLEIIFFEDFLVNSNGKNVREVLLNKIKKVNVINI